MDQYALRVLRGNPTDEELAVLVAVLASRPGGAPEPAATAGGELRARWDRRSAVPNCAPSWRCELPRAA